MTEHVNVLGRRARPTRKAYRDAVHTIIVGLQGEHALNDKDLAERLGCSAGTVANARNKDNNLDGVTLANIEFEFGPAALDPFLALGGSRSVPICDGEAMPANHSLTVAQALALIIETQGPGSEGGMVTTAREAARILPQLIDARTALDALIGHAQGASLRAVSL